MLSLSNTTGYAVQALICLARCDSEWQQAKDISLCSGAPLAYLQKVLSQLRDAGLVKGKRGYRGGFKLTQSAEKITLLTIAEVVDPEFQNPTCLLGFKNCSDEEPCPSHSFWKQNRMLILKELESLTIEDVADFTSGTFVQISTAKTLKPKVRTDLKTKLPQGSPTDI